MVGEELGFLLVVTRLGGADNVLNDWGLLTVITCYLFSTVDDEYGQAVHREYVY